MRVLVVDDEINLTELLAMFKLSEASAVPVARRPAAAAPASPVRELGRRIATAFTGNAAVKQDDWEEF